NGEVDFLWRVPGPDQRRLAADPRVTLRQTAFNPGGSHCLMTLSFNLERPILKEPRLRRALAHTIDREAFLQQILFGEGQVATAPIASAIPWAHAPALPLPPFDRATAARLLDAAGWQQGADGIRVARGIAEVPDGTRLSLDF